MNNSELTEEVIKQANQYIENKEFEPGFMYLSEHEDLIENNAELLKLMGLCCVNLQKNDQAMVCFEKALILVPEDATSLFYLGLILDVKGMLPEAAEYYIKVIQLRPEYIDAYKNISVIFIKNGDIDNALKYAQHAENISDKTDYQIYYILATIFMQLSRYNDAINCLNTALKLNPEHVQMLNNLGSCYLATFDAKKAIANFKKAYALDANNPVTNFNFGMIYQVQNKYKEAYTYFEKAYKTDPNRAYLESMANAAAKSKKLDEAIDAYRMLLTIDSTSSNYRRNLAEILGATGQYDDAIKELTILYKANPADMKCIEKLIDMYIVAQKFSGLKKLLAEVVKRGKVSSNIYYTYAVVCAKTGEIDNAIGLFKKVMLLTPQDPIPHKDLGVIYLAQKLFDYARDEFETAYKLAPDNYVMVFEYATFLYQVHEYEKAEIYYKKALELEPENINNNLYAGFNYLQENKLDEAKKHLEKVYKKIPDDAVVTFSLARIYYLQKKFDTAKQLLIGLSSFNNDLEILNLFALIHVELKEFEEAVLIYKKIEEFTPSSPNIIMQIAKCEIELENKDEALTYLNKYLELVPDSEEANDLIWKIS